MDPSDSVNARLRQLPAVDRLVDSAGRETALARWSRLAAARAVLERARTSIRAGEGEVEARPEVLAAEVREIAFELERPSPRRLVNATGVVLHTNLGRAPLAPGAAHAAAEAAAGYSDLELELASGRRGSRLARITRLLCLASGAQDALVVNNNAAAVLLAVDTLAAGGEVVLSRGELVEIGGSFRIPEILAASRAKLVEIGTTNRTHLADYEAALGANTRMLLKVHRSNFELRGFTHEVSLAELGPLARERGVPLVEDRGSGSFLDLRPYGIPEPCAHEGLRAGADLVLFSGDKLLGGPQAGIVLGRADLLERMKRAPLARALRVDKMTLAGLDWTLRALLADEGVVKVPTLRMLTSSPEELRLRAERLKKAIAPHLAGEVIVKGETSLVGGGALPDFELEGYAVEVQPAAADGSVGELSRRLRGADPPVIARVQHDALVLDPRTIDDAEVELVAQAFTAVV